MYLNFLLKTTEILSLAFYTKTYSKLAQLGSIVSPILPQLCITTILKLAPPQHSAYALRLVRSHGLQALESCISFREVQQYSQCYNVHVYVAPAWCDFAGEGTVSILNA